MASLARRHQRATNIWPGFVDALATLLMVIIFLLLIFVLAQFFLSNALSGRDEALRQLEGEISQLAQLLALEKKANEDLGQDVTRLSAELQASITARDRLQADVASLLLRAETAERQVADTLTARLVDQAALDAQAERLGGLEAQLAALGRERDRLEDNLDAAETVRLATQDELDAKTLELARLAQAVERLEVLKADLEKQITDLAQDAQEKGDALLAEQELSESARAEVALLNQQLDALRRQLAGLQAALDASEAANAEQQVVIKNLGSRLNAALATKVQELSRYRSEFFGKLRELLGGRAGIRVVGDRFVFQSEVLFGVGSADLEEVGREQLLQLAQSLLEIEENIPADIDWVLRVDGHTDRIPINTVRFPSNWELSAARAISVVKHLTDLGIPPNRLMAAGFGSTSPIDTGAGVEALSRNRRIEFKLTQR